jgi:hypothetical protein
MLQSEVNLLQQVSLQQDSNLSMQAAPLQQIWYLVSMQKPAQDWLEGSIRRPASSTTGKLE